MSPSNGFTPGGIGSRSRSCSMSWAWMCANAVRLPPPVRLVWQSLHFAPARTMRYGSPRAGRGAATTSNATQARRYPPRRREPELAVPHRPIHRLLGTGQQSAPRGLLSPRQRRVQGAQRSGGGSVTGFERRLEGREVVQLVGETLQALEHPVHLALCPLELLRAHLRERAAELIVRRHQAVDPGETGLRDAAVDLTREVDDLIRLTHH